MAPESNVIKKHILDNPLAKEKSNLSEEPNKISPHFDKIVSAIKEVEKVKQAES